MPSAEEQYELELINDARLDPIGNAYQYITGFEPIAGTQKLIDGAIKGFNVDGAAFLQALGSFPASQPLAFSDPLEASALAHDRAMIAANQQEHQLPGELDPGGRAQAAGYGSPYVGENIYAYAQDPLYAHAGFMIDYGFDAGGMQSGAGHRANILNPDYREVGVGIIHPHDSGGRSALSSSPKTSDVHRIPHPSSSVSPTTIVTRTASTPRAKAYRVSPFRSETARRYRMQAEVTPSRLQRSDRRPSG